METNVPATRGRLEMRFANRLHSLESRWKNVRDTLSQVIAAKLSNPGEAISNWDLVEAAIQDYEASIAEAAAHNNAIKRVNSDITRIKKDAASANEGSLETDLRKLRNTEIRHEPDVAFLCTDITSKRTDKARLEGEKIKVREQLTTQSEALLADYENDINKMLEAIGSTFKITGVKPSFAGGKASSTYKIQINGQALDLGDARTPPGTPCFRTALSSGDKSALALAFFLVRLRRDSAIASKIVVFDDPFTSMDCFRRTFTKQEIARMAGIAKQVIVLSHDPSFLKDLRDSSTSATVKSLRVKRSSTTYTVSEFDIEQHCLPQAQRDFFVLTSFIEDGLPDGSDLGTVARSIRPFVENSIRSRFPELPGGIMLGDIITRARESKATEPIAALKKDLLDLEGINDYSKRFHHPSNETPNDQELRTFAQRAIQLNRGS